MLQINKSPQLVNKNTPVVTNKWQKILKKEEKEEIKKNNNRDLRRNLDEEPEGEPQDPSCRSKSSTHTSCGPTSPSSPSNSKETLRTEDVVLEVERGPNFNPPGRRTQLFKRLDLKATMEKMNKNLKENSKPSSKDRKAVKKNDINNNVKDLDDIVKLLKVKQKIAQAREKFNHTKNLRKKTADVCE